ncbi:MAG: hypothetical protein ACPGGK_04555 [Pikeienuella sp.]
MNLSASQKYGAAVALAIFFIGWTTGMAPPSLVNIAFSALMGAFAGFLYSRIHKYFNKEQD